MTKLAKKNRNSKTQAFRELGENKRCAHCARPLGRKGDPPAVKIGKFTYVHYDCPYDPPQRQELSNLEKAGIVVPNRGPSLVLPR